MRALLLFASLLLPLAGRAQYGPAKGSCLLRDGRQLTGTTRLVAATTQEASKFIFYVNNKPQELTADEVRSCQVGKHCFVVSGGFVAPDDNGGIPVSRDFVEVIDTTGRVQVFAYTYERMMDGGMGRPAAPLLVPTAGGGTRMTGGAIGGGISYHMHTLYLLRPQGGRTFMPYDVKVKQAVIGTKKEFNQADAVTLAALFADDPVLQQEILAGRIREGQITAVVAAYNQGIRRKAR